MHINYGITCIGCVAGNGLSVYFATFIWFRKKKKDTLFFWIFEKGYVLIDCGTNARNKFSCMIDSLLKMVDKSAKTIILIDVLAIS